MPVDYSMKVIIGPVREIIKLHDHCGSPKYVSIFAFYSLVQWHRKIAYVEDRLFVYQAYKTEYLNTQK